MSDFALPPGPHPSPVPDPAPDTYTLTCPSHATSPRIARDFVAAALRARGLGDLVDDAALCTSEVVTNAVLHACAGPGGPGGSGGSVALLRLAVTAHSARVTVYDPDPRPPALRQGFDSESGRGLWMVDSLTAGCWGTTAAARGKGVWFMLAKGRA